MDQSGLLLLTALGTIFVLGGLALQPLWRRLRRERRKHSGGMTLSIGRARERLLWVNAFGSIAVGGVMLGIVQIELPRYQRDQAIEKELARFSVSCTRAVVTVENLGDDRQSVRLSDAQVYLSQGYLGEEPDHWRIDLSAEKSIGAHDRGRFALPEIAVCKPPVLRFTFDVPFVCEVKFRFQTEVVDTWKRCRLYE